MGRLLTIIAFSLGLAAAAHAAPGQNPYTHFFNDSFGNFQEELELARDEGKKGIMLFFEMDECPFCHWMKQNVLNQPEVQAWFREHFLLFPVDVEGDVEVTTFDGETMPMKDFAFKVNRVRATPVFAFYDLDGHQIHRYTGKTSGIDEFMLMGKYISEGAYKEMRFTNYKRQNR